MMSLVLVEYASSDSDDEATEITPAASPPTAAAPPLPPPSQNPVRTSSDTGPAPSSNVPAPSQSNFPAYSSNDGSAPSLPPLDELPDVEFLLSSPQGSRKRESNGNGMVPSLHKFPRGRTQSSLISTTCKECSRYSRNTSPTAADWQEQCGH